MLTRGQRLVCAISDLGYQGEGISRVDGQVVFVPFALPQETVEISIESVKKNHASGRLLRVMQESPTRVDPICPVFTRCGGCACQHMEYEQQLRFKQAAVQNSLKRIAGSGLRVLPVMGMDLPWRYRNKTTWQFSHDGGRFRAGFFALKSRQLVETGSCPIAQPGSEAAAAAVLSLVNGGLSQMASRMLSGLSRVTSRVNRKGEALLAMAFQGGAPDCLGALAAGLHSAMPSLMGVWAVTLNPDGMENAQHISGQAYLEETIDGLVFRISPMSFFQVNPDIYERMYKDAIQQTLGGQADTLVDVYSGTGTLSLLAARHFRRVIGLELSGEAVQDARLNAQANQIKHVDFIQGFAENELPALLTSGVRPDAILLDPPREGAHPKVIAAMAQAQPGRIVYISCHPPSQARDVALLQAAGYEAVRSQPYDMFCQTAEVENIITLIRRST